VIACLLLGVAGINLAPGDKAEGQTLVRFVETSPFLKRGFHTGYGPGDLCENGDRTWSGRYVRAHAIGARPPTAGPERDCDFPGIDL